MSHGELLQVPVAQYTALKRPKRVPPNPGIEVLSRYVQSHNLPAYGRPDNRRQQIRPAPLRAAIHGLA